MRKNHIKTFAECTDVYAFQDVPMMRAESSTIYPAEDYGDDTFVIEIDHTYEQDYWEYLELLEHSKFQKYADNGTNGLNYGCVFTSSYVKGNLVLTVTHITKRGKTYLAAKEHLPLSKHLHYHSEYTDGNLEGAKTTLHMTELHTFGNCFILQLKNGHFILEDGGMARDTLYLLEYLENLVPKGEKPVIEAWFFSHGHDDHMGILEAMAENPSYAERLCVEEVFFSRPSKMAMGVVEPELERCVKGFPFLKNTEGKQPPICRPQTGQRYYYNDIVIEILHTQEQLHPSCYGNGTNDTSNWLLYTIEGQTFLSAGDAGEGSVGVVKKTYESSFLQFDIMATFHHGQNVYESYIRDFKYKTVLYTTFTIGTQLVGWSEEENAIMQELAEECMCWGDGAKILRFPYQVGDCISLPPRIWKYHPERVVPKPFVLK